MRRWVRLYASVPKTVRLHRSIGRLGGGVHPNLAFSLAKKAFTVAFLTEKTASTFSKFRSSNLARDSSRSEFRNWSVTAAVLVVLHSVLPSFCAICIRAGGLSFCLESFAGILFSIFFF